MSVSAILPKVWNYTVRGLKVYPSAVFGAKGQEVMTKAYESVFTAPGAVKYNIFNKQWWSQLWNGTKSAGLAAEKYAGSFAGKGFWASSWASIKGIPTTIKAGWRAGGMKAAAAGASKLGTFGAKFKGALGGVGKKLPIIGSLILVACELPNIFRATKNEGIGSGLVETGKAAARIGGATLGASAGAAIGTAICPGIGTAIGGLIGWIAGEWGAKKIVGKSYSEKQAEKEQQIQEAIAQQQQQQQMYYPQQLSADGTTNPFQSQAYNPQQLAQMQQLLYGNNTLQDDFMYNASRPRFNYQA